MLAGFSERGDVALLRGRGGAERRPCLHQPSSLLEHVAVPIGGLDLALDRVRQRWHGPGPVGGHRPVTAW